MKEKKEILKSKAYPFFDFQPVFWTMPSGESEKKRDSFHSVKRNHGLSTGYVLHNQNDEINEGRHLLDKVIIEYKVRKNSYDLFTIRDFFEVPFSFSAKAKGNIMGDLAERIARRNTKYFLKHFSKKGDTGGIFDKSFNPKKCNNYIVTHTDSYVLKIVDYPNLVILKRSGRGKYGYENIKELDGLFDYRYKNVRHILVLESKLDKINVSSDDLITSLFKPLRELFPEAEFSYVLFSDRNALYVKKKYHSRRCLRDIPVKIYRKLHENGIGVLYFTFNEHYSDFDKMCEHLIAQYRVISNLGIEIYGKMMLSNSEIILFDGGETPYIKLLKDYKSDMWKEVKLTHKSKVKPDNTSRKKTTLN